MDEKQNTREEKPDELMRKIVQWQQANPKATLTEIEETVEAELAQLHKQLVEEGTTEKATAPQPIAQPEQLVIVRRHHG